MEFKENLQTPFTDVIVIKKNNQLDHKVYRKKTHTNRYLHNGSNHDPKQKRTVINTLLNRSLRICEERYVDDEIKHITNVLQTNGYNRKYIIRATRPKEEKRNSSEDQPQSTVYLPYICHITKRIGKILKKEKINTLFKPTKKLSEYLSDGKHKILLENTERLTTANHYSTRNTQTLKELKQKGRKNIST
nr:uncharacterized protein LOC111515018 [Leptinotarsa decemlineata]